MPTDTVHHIVKDAFHEMVAGIQKQPYYPSIKKPKSPLTASQKRARKLAEQAAGQSYGTGSMSYSASAGKKKKRIEREVASQNLLLLQLGQKHQLVELYNVKKS